MAAVLALPGALALAALLVAPPAPHAGADRVPGEMVHCVVCDDGNPCTVDGCSEDGSACVHRPVDCDDHNPCTTDEVCRPEAPWFGCSSAPVEDSTPCDDGDTCTLGDLCNQGECEPLELWPEGTACNGPDPCSSTGQCNATGRCIAPPVAEGASCDDRDACTSGTTCTVRPEGGLACTGTRLACDDGNSCTDDACDPATGLCGPVGSLCDDGNPCTVDACDAVAGACVHSPDTGASCDDGNRCTEGDACGADGRCGGSARACEDIYSCTIDACDPAIGCTHTSDCDDGNACTGDACYADGCQHFDLTGPDCIPADRCFWEGRLSCVNNQLVCVGTVPKSCNDDNSCTIDSCHPSFGCVYQPVSCDDGNPCTFDPPCSISCPPDNPFRPGPCDDNDICTTNDTCAPADLDHPEPYCTGTSVCDDGSPCTDDLCDASAPGGCRHVNNTALCNDGIACTNNDRCAEGACRPGVPSHGQCSDNDICTDDVCDPTRGCVNTPHCDDGNPCTQNGCSVTCTGSGCTTACRFLPISGPACGDACVTGGACVDGACVGTPITCDDANVCTTDTCDAQSGCRHESDLDCSDVSPCTLDSCDPALGCRHDVDPTLPDGDSDGVPDRCDLCPAAANPDQADGDIDGVADACDVCPTLPNPDQDPGDCLQEIVDLGIEFGAKGAALVSWRTTHEVSLAGFDLVAMDARGRRTLLVPSRVPCTACTTGLGAEYHVTVSKHLSGRGVHVELIGVDGTTLGRFGPAIRR